MNNNYSNTETSNKLAWMRVILLAFSAFIFNTTEFVPVALLSEISNSFNMLPEQTGLMITIYAWVVAIVSLPLMILTSKIERRKLLIIIFILFILSHILSGFSWDYKSLIISRIGIAFVHAIFWSITASLAIRVAPKGKTAQALSLLSIGIILATILGIPIGRMIGQWLGWRATFLCIGIIAFIIMLILRRYLPLLPNQNSGTIKSIPILFKRMPLVGIYILTVIIITAHFTASNYLEPFALHVANLDKNTTTFIFLLFGGAGSVGTILFGRYSSKLPRAFLFFAIIIVTISLSLLLVSSFHPVIFSILIIFWGASFLCTALSLQVKVMHLAPDATDIAMSIYSGIFNIGIGGGALFGNQIISHIGLPNIGYIGAILGVIAIILYGIIMIKYRNIMQTLTQKE